ncbi:MAG: RrF2 family transcriptional regulator [Nitrospiraceae bacterium]
MKLSLKAKYGIMAALDLALHNGSSPVQTKSIARRQAIPARFLEQVLNAMRKAGFVESLRGAQGGYLLTQRPADVSLAALVEALDGPLSPAPVLGLSARRVQRQLKPDVLLSQVWDRVREAELGVLRGVTLKDLAESYRRLDQQGSLMYHI